VEHVSGKTYSLQRFFHYSLFTTSLIVKYSLSLPDKLVSTASNEIDDLFMGNQHDSKLAFKLGSLALKL